MFFGVHWSTQYRGNSLEKKCQIKNRLCGQVTFECKGEPVTFVICHCKNRKQSGGVSFQANAFYKPQVRQEAVKRCMDNNTKSGKALTRSFCSNCGSSLFLAPAGGDTTIVHATNIKAYSGLLSVAPKKEFFGQDRCAWIQGIYFRN
ncbi:DUF636 domain-containing protein [Coprinopsis sp. MPI-PUGE-AT-0042]|nr:DUF636 domain-containing protein [Coprinopsis sp. MPI-PUGE-AT-0042]